MSLFSDLAQAIGQTIESLAQDVGADSSFLETIVNDLDSNGVNVFSAAAKLGLSPVGFLRSILDLMSGDPHQLLLQRLTGPIKPMSDPLYRLSGQWDQLAHLHQTTAQGINAHINDLFQSNGTYSYSGPAADALWGTHQGYQQYFAALVDHAQIQQGRHAALDGNVNEYLSMMPGQVYNLSTPMAAFGLLSLDTTTTAPPDQLEQLIEGSENNLQTLDQDEGVVLPGPEDPIWDFLAICIILLLLFIGILKVIQWFQGLFNNHQNQQKNTTTPKPPTPLPAASMADDLSRQSGVPLSVVEDIIKSNPGLTKDEYALLIEYYKKYGTYPYNVRSVFKGVDQKGNPTIYFVTAGDLKHIREHDDNLQGLSDQELLDLIKKLLQGEPDYVEVDKSRKLIDYYYDNVEVNGRYVTVIIRMSTSTPGRIISTYEEW